MTYVTNISSFSGLEIPDAADAAPDLTFRDKVGCFVDCAKCEKSESPREKYCSPWYNAGYASREVLVHNFCSGYSVDRL